jgi:hypothetical protein
VTTIRIVAKCETGDAEERAIAAASKLVHGGDHVRLEVRTNSLVEPGVAYVLDVDRIRDVHPPELRTS